MIRLLEIASQSVLEHENSFLNNVVLSRKPFGIDSKTRPSKKGDLVLISSGGIGKFSSNKVTSRKELINKWKVLISKASYDHGGQPDKEGKRRIFSRVEAHPPGTICTESYLVVGPYDSQEEAKNMVFYLKTKFCRFLISTILFTQNISRDRFRYVPNLPMTEFWTDEKLYEKYGLTVEEIEFIESTVRPMAE